MLFPALYLAAIFFLCLQVAYELSYNYQEDLLGHFSMALLFDINHPVLSSRIPQLLVALPYHPRSIGFPLTFQLIQFPKIFVAIHQYLRTHYLAWNLYSCSSLTLFLQLVSYGFQYMSILVVSLLLLFLQVHQDILLMIYVVQHNPLL